MSSSLKKKRGSPEFERREYLQHLGGSRMLTTGVDPADYASCANVQIDTPVTMIDGGYEVMCMKKLEVNVRVSASAEYTVDLQFMLHGRPLGGTGIGALTLAGQYDSDTYYYLHDSTSMEKIGPRRWMWEWPEPGQLMVEAMMLWSAQVADTDQFSKWYGLAFTVWFTRQWIDRATYMHFHNQQKALGAL